MTSPRLVLHHPSLQASQTALLPPMPAVTPLRSLLKMAGQYTKESLSRFKSMSALDYINLHYSPHWLPGFPAGLLFHFTQFYYSLLFFSCTVFGNQQVHVCAHQVPFPASWFANDQLLALQLFRTAQLVQLRVGGGGVFSAGLSNNASCRFQTKVRRFLRSTMTQYLELIQRLLSAPPRAPL